MSEKLHYGIKKAIKLKLKSPEQIWESIPYLDKTAEQKAYIHVLDLLRIAKNARFMYANAKTFQHGFDFQLLWNALEEIKKEEKL